MSGWDPGDGRLDTMTFGSEERGPSPRRKLIAAAAAGLLIGVPLGVVVGQHDRLPAPFLGAREQPSPTTEVVPGPVEKTFARGDHGPQFGVQVFNDGEQTVTVTGLAFADLRSEVVDVREAQLTPGSWGQVAFSAPPDCSAGAPTTLSSVSVTLRTSAGHAVRTLALPGGGETLLDYHAALCSPNARPSADALVGVWALEEAFPSDELEGLLLMRFGRDGTFAADPEGVMLLDEERGVEGRYRFHRGRLVISVVSGYGCTPGDRSVWRPVVLEVGGNSTSGHTPLMALSWVGGECPDDGRGMVWLMRRIIDETDTPGRAG